MKLMNIEHGSHCVQIHYEYNGNLRSYIFTNDIQIGCWTVCRTVEVGGPRETRYKYDYKNYLKFIITDKNGETRERLFYYNSPCIEMTVSKKYEDNVDQYGLKLFLENHPIFDSEDWAFYEIVEKLAKVNAVLNLEIGSPDCKLEKIRDIVK